MDLDLKKFQPIPPVPCNQSTHRIKYWFFSLVLPIILFILCFAGAHSLLGDGILCNLIGGGCGLFAFLFFIDYGDKIDKEYEKDCSYYRSYFIELHSEISYFSQLVDDLPDDTPDSERRRIMLHLSSLKRILADANSRIPRNSDWYHP